MLRPILQFTFGFSGGLFCHSHLQISWSNNYNWQLNQRKETNYEKLRGSPFFFHCLTFEIIISKCISLPTSTSQWLAVVVSSDSVYIYTHIFSGSWRTSYPRGLFFLIWLLVLTSFHGNSHQQKKEEMGQWDRFSIDMFVSHSHGMRRVTRLKWKGTNKNH